MTTAARADERGRPFWIGLTVGIVIMLFGVTGALVNFGATHPVQFATWLVGSDLVHDLVVAPAACAVGWLVLAVVPTPLRSPMRAGLFATAVAVAVAWAPLHGDGRLADNPSLAPLNYASALLTVLAVVWLACAVWAIVAVARRHRRPAVPGVDAVVDS